MVFEAFNIALVVDNIECSTDVLTGSISCLVCDGGVLYLGTDRGFVLQYQFSIDKNLEVSTALLTSKHVLNASIGFMHAASAMNKLLVLADECLQSVELTSLVNSDSCRSIAGVNSVGVNTNPPASVDPFSLQVCVARRSCSLIALELTSSGTWRSISELNTSGMGGSAAEAVVFSGTAVCAVVAGRYWVFDVLSSHRQHVLDVPSDVQRPLTAILTQREFVVLGPARLALLATETGTSDRAPLPLQHDSVSWTVHASYLVYTDGVNLSYISVSDPGSSGQMSLPGAVTVVSCDGNLLVATSHGVLALCPASPLQQMEDLLKSADYPALLSLLERQQLHPSQLPADIALILAVKLLASDETDKSLSLLTNSQLSPEQVAALVSDEAALSTELTQILSGVGSNLVSALVADCLLATVDSSHSQSVCKTACLLLLQHRDVDSALRYITAAGCGVPPLSDHPILWARLLWAAGDFHQAADIYCSCVDLYSSEVVPMICEIADSIDDPSIFRQLTTCLLKCDESRAADVFSALARAPERHNRVMTIDDVVSFLQLFPATLERYLRELIENRQNLPANVGTELACLYLNRIERGAGDDVTVTSHTTSLLMKVVRCDSGVQLVCRPLLARALTLKLSTAAAHLHARMGEYEQCIELLATCGSSADSQQSSPAVVSLDRVRETVDFIECVAPPGSEKVAPSIFVECVAPPGSDKVAPSIFNKSDAIRNRLYRSLLNICLQHAKTDATCILHLLNFCPAVLELDVCSVLHQLPDSWSLPVVQPFLTAARRRLAAQLSISRQLHALHSCHLSSQKLQLALYRSTSVRLDSDSRCAVCNVLLSADNSAVCLADSSGAPGGDVTASLMLVHTHCIPPRLSQSVHS